MKSTVVLLLDRIRSSLFLIPMVFIVAGVGLAVGALRLDETVSTSSWNLPLGIGSTVESSRAVLSTIAGATVTVAGVAFSIALLMFQLASSQYSPRVMHGLFRDSFNKWVMGLVVGTFTYCLIALQAAHDAVSDDGTPFAPTISALISVALGISSVMAIVAFIDHNAHGMDIGHILNRVARETKEQIRKTRGGQLGDPTLDDAVPAEGGHTVPFRDDGWVQHIDFDTLVGIIPPNGTLQLHTSAGRFATEGTPLATLWPEPDNPKHISKALADAVHLGTSRTLIEDVAYGLRQLVDVALRALSPGVNDPTTAKDAILHATAVMHELLRHPSEPTARALPGNRRILTPLAATNSILITQVFDELRHAARDQPSVQRCLADCINTLRNSTTDIAVHEALDKGRVHEWTSSVH